jgi:putative Ca2+/H+ antiporter (TMEM165/GDT1 family)
VPLHSSSSLKPLIKVEELEQVLKAFSESLLLITLSELGDKTFFIALILAMRHSRRLVFTGVVIALAGMTVLSVLVGQAISLMPQIYVHFGKVALFFGFGLKLLYDVSRMPIDAEDAEAREATAVVNEAEEQFAKKPTHLAIILEAFSLTFLAEWGDRTQFATIAMAASNTPLGVTLGAIVGHAICAAIAVMGGRLIGGKLSERIITAIGGSLFLLFGAIALIESY